ncbi:Ternary complex factor MIP1, leucine-zipper [Trema orientale]|uniref:Ternary complex factor MIP1, leucine-zipper n=1 Tax=Trema orientale TaxID=63057 RepID=A0A2P5DSR8_TREOI|nr:Ternary complex factor MIP1, leucine-zipper [Trema orientale]
MKFEELLMQRSEDQQRRLALEEEVKKLQAELEGEERLRNVLHYALDGPMLSNPCLSSYLPPQVQVLLSEIVMVEEEIYVLERKVDELTMQLYQERAQGKELDIRQQKRVWQQNHLLCEAENHRSVLNDQRSRSHNYEVLRKERMNGDRRSSLSSASDNRTWSSTSSNREIAELTRKVGRRTRIQRKVDNASGMNPNELSEELLKCLIGIFLELNQTSMDREGSPIVPKLALSCMNSKGLIGKASFNCKPPTFLFNYSSSNSDPYDILPDLDLRDVGPYKNFIHITSSSLDITRFSECLTGFRRLRVLMHKLCSVDLTFLTYKQKLAFWINIYNACIMHAFLEHGLPSTQEKLLALMNKAALNVGGIVLNALAIEHFILRYPSKSKHKGPAYEKEMLLRHAYGLGYPEPNVTFALCRGTWSSPALRIYTPDNIVNEMERAKVDYLEASVGVTSRKKIVVPKLLQWYMSDFADDMESLLEWIYSQLPRTGSLKRLMMECLNGEVKSPINKMVEVQPYESEFRYMLPS